MSVDAQRVQAVFQAVLEAPDPATRAAVLERECATDPELGQRVHALLQAYENPASILDRPPVAAATVAIEDVPPESSGAAIGPYKLLERIGEGGMGTVWMAQQTEPVKRVVALKLIKAGMDSKQVIARFEAERQALALMDHPNIARVLDAGTTENGRPYFVMDLVKGVQITKYCDEHRLTPRQRLELFIPVCQAIQHAHQKGIIHRDLKPSNVLVALYDGKPVPKVIDFGVAKAAGHQLTDKTLVTGFGNIVGTLEYMSPEQAEINQLDIDTRSDIYALGVLLYELLTGSPPFTRKDLEKAGMLEMLRVIREQEPSKPSTKLSTAEGLPTLAANRGTEPAKLTKLVRGELDWIVMKALEKDRSRRYETANGFAMDVQRYLADEPVQACPPSVGYRLRKFVRRNRAAVSVVMLFSVVLLAATAISIALAVWATEAQGQAESLWESEKAEREKATEAERERKRQLVHAKLAQGKAGRRGRQVGQRFESLKVLSEAAALARELEMETSVIHELRDETVACLALADIRPVKSWLGFPEGTTDSITFDADLQRYSRGDAKGNTEVRQVEDDRLLARLPGHGPGGEHSGTSTCRFSPDGQLLAVRYWHQIPGAQPGNCQVWDWQQQKVVFQPPFRVCSSPMAFSADGRSLALGEQNGTITVYQVHGWKGKQLKAAFTPTALAFHPDGTRLAVCGQNGMIQVWAMPACKELYKASVPKYACSIAWHSELLAVGCGDKNIHLFDTESGRAHLVLRGHQMGPTVLNFAAAGDGLVSACWDGTSRLWDPWSGRELLRFPAAADHVSRDGTRIAGREGRTLTVWDLNAGREYLALPPGTGGEIQELAVSPSGRWLVAGGDQPRIWDLGLRKGVATLPGSRVGAPRFHPKRPEFFTSGLNGLYRWSFAEGPMGLRVQPVDRLLPPDVGRFGMDRDGRQAVVARGIGATVITLENPPGKASMLNHRACTSAGISPDGRWAATGTHNGFGVRIWDVRTGGQVAELMPQERLTVPTFSPDGRWLLIATEFKFAIWASSTWQPIREIPREQAGGAAPATFAPDGKILAAAISTTTVGLFDTQTWRILTKLQSPDEGLLRHMTFTPDGAQLLVATLDNSIRIWDLRRVREQLAQADLDWNHLPYRPAPETDALRPVRVEVDSLLPVSESK